MPPTYQPLLLIANTSPPSPSSSAAAAPAEATGKPSSAKRKPRVPSSHPDYARYRREQLAVAAKKSREKRKQEEEAMKRENAELEEEVRSLRELAASWQREDDKRTRMLTAEGEEGREGDEEEDLVALHNRLLKADFYDYMRFTYGAFSLLTPRLDGSSAARLALVSRIADALDKAKFECLRLMDISSSMPFPQDADFDTASVSTSSMSVPSSPSSGAISQTAASLPFKFYFEQRSTGRLARYSVAFAPDGTVLLRMDTAMVVPIEFGAKRLIEEKFSAKALAKPNPVMKEMLLESSPVPELSWNEADGREIVAVRQRDPNGEWVSVFYVEEEEHARSTLRRTDEGPIVIEGCMMRPQQKSLESSASSSSLSSSSSSASSIDDDVSRGGERKYLLEEPEHGTVKCYSACRTAAMIDSAKADKACGGGDGAERAALHCLADFSLVQKHTFWDAAVTETGERIIRGTHVTSIPPGVSIGPFGAGRDIATPERGFSPKFLQTIHKMQAAMEQQQLQRC